MHIVARKLLSALDRGFSSGDAGPRITTALSCEYLCLTFEMGAQRTSMGLQVHNFMETSKLRTQEFPLSRSVTLRSMWMGQQLINLKDQAAPGIGELADLSEAAQQGIQHIQCVPLPGPASPKGALLAGWKQWDDSSDATKYLAVLESLAAALANGRPGLVEQYIARYNALQLGNAPYRESQPCHAAFRAGAFPYCMHRYIQDMPLHGSEDGRRPLIREMCALGSTGRQARQRSSSSAPRAQQCPAHGYPCGSLAGMTSAGRLPMAACGNSDPALQLNNSHHPRAPEPWRAPYHWDLADPPKDLGLGAHQSEAHRDGKLRLQTGCSRSPTWRGSAIYSLTESNLRQAREASHRWMEAEEGPTRRVVKDE
eukprot:jgi/Botrbrau1/21729/Bobra.43_1s0123.1